MKDKVLVSVIIPSYNEEENIRNCLETMLNQSYQELEIIVVDDGSTDGTMGIVSEFPVKLLKQFHKGPAVARNFGVKNSQGEILVFMDSDMSFTKDFIKELVDPIIEGKLKGTFSKNEYVANWENVWARCWNYNQGWPDKKMIPDDYPEEGMDFRAILRSEFERVGGFDDKGYTDTWSLYQKLGYRPHAVVGAKYFHNNPNRLGEVFIQSKWAAKRDYKFGLIGKIVVLFRRCLPISILVGFFIAAKKRQILFVVFKIIYDLGAFIGISEIIFRGRLSK